MAEYEYDLVVVGAGPAGSSAAYAAAKNGIKVALLEKEENVAQTVRTSGVTWIDYAKEFGIPEDCYNPIKTYNFCSPNNKASISDEKAKAAVLDVRKTYRFLAEQAKNNGAEIFVNTNVTEVITENEKVVGVKASSSNDKIIFHAKMVIDASGFQSVVSKSLGLVKQWKRFGVGAEYEAEVEHVNSDTWWLMVGQMELTEKDAMALVKEGLLCVEFGEYDEAIENYDKALKIIETAEIYLNKGDLFVETELFQEAIQCYDKAIELDPNDSLIWYNKGVVLTDIEKLDEAIQCYDKAIELESDYSDAWYNKAELLKHKGLEKEATICFEKVKELERNESKLTD